MADGTKNDRSGLWRSRWAALGAAVAVTVGAGGLVAVDAASSAPSSFVSITPARILDTRTDVGLTGPFVSGVAQQLQVTGTVATQPPGDAPPVSVEVVPSTATSVVFNVTVVNPATKGFLSIRPGDATGVPATSNINWAAGGPNIANSVTVQLPAAGTIDIYVNGTVGHVLIDVAGYYLPATSGPPGPQGEPGDDGAPGPQGVPGMDAVSPARVVWVATADGDFTLLSAALASITDATASTPYVIKIAPGVYNEASTVNLKDHVDVEGSGQGVTTLNCACASSTEPGAFVEAGDVTAEIRHLTINNTGGTGDYASGVSTTGVTDQTFSMLHVTTTATGATRNYAVFNNSSSPSMNTVTVTATGGTDTFGVFNFGASPSMTNVTATATGGTTYNGGVYNFGSSSPTIRGSVITGNTNSIRNDNGPSVRVADSTLDGPVFDGGLGITCVGVYTAAFVALNTTCTP